MQSDSKTDITIIVALITAIAAILAPLITSVINQIGAHRLRALELFFEEKTKVYKQFLETTAQFPVFPTEDDVSKLNCALNLATLYSSRETGKAMSIYVHHLVNSKTQTTDVGDAYLAVYHAMQNELKKYKKHY